MPDKVGPTATPSLLPMYVRPGHAGAPPVWLTGSVADNRWVQDAWFKLDGVAVSTMFDRDHLSVRGEIRARLGGLDRSHDVVLRVRDAAGNIGSAKGKVIVDGRAPVVALVPPDGAVLDNTQVTATVTVTELNPAQIAFETFDWAHPGSKLPFARHEPLTLSEGEHTLTATATDAAGNTGSASARVLIDLTAPTLTTSLADGLVVWGCLEDKGMDLPWTFSVEDATATTFETAITTATATSSAPRGGALVDVVSRLEPESNVIELAVIDEAGHETRLKRLVVFERIAATITMLALTIAATSSPAR